MVVGEVILLIQSSFIVCHVILQEDILKCDPLVPLHGLQAVGSASWWWLLACFSAFSLSLHFNSPPLPLSHQP